MPQVKTSEQILEQALSEALATRREDKKQLKDALEVIVRFARETRDFLSKEKNQLRQEAKELQEAQKLLEKSNKKEIQALSKKIDKRLSELKNGRDGRDGKDGESVDVDEVLSAVLALMPEQSDLMPLVDKLTEDMEDFKEDVLKRIKKIKRSSGGGGGVTVFGSVQHVPRHESFTMDGADTSVTLAQGVAADGNAVIVRYQGQTLDMTTHYTVSGNKITFTFTPDNATTISVTYWP